MFRVPIDDHVDALGNRIERCFEEFENRRRLAIFDKRPPTVVSVSPVTAVSRWTRLFVNGDLNVY